MAAVVLLDQALIHQSRQGRIRPVRVLFEHVRLSALRAISLRAT